MSDAAGPAPPAPGQPDPAPEPSAGAPPAAASTAPPAYGTPTPPPVGRRRRAGLFWGLVLICLGLIFQLNNFGFLWWVRPDVLWPLAVVAAGLYLLLRSWRR